MKTSEIEAALRDDFDADAKVALHRPRRREPGPLGLPLHRPVPQGRPGRSRRAHGLQEPQGGRRPRHRLGDRGRRQGVPRRHVPHPPASTCSPRTTCGPTRRARPSSSIMVNGAGACPRATGRRAPSTAPRHQLGAFQKIRVKNRACYQCAIACRQVHEVDGDRQGEGPEYETIALCGANCGIGDIAALMKFNEVCDEWGMDTISTGSSSAWPWTSPRRASTTSACASARPRATSRRRNSSPPRDGIGAELALGARALAAKYGVPELAMEVKNLELPGYDPRGSFGMSLAYATSDRGGCHMRSYPIADEVIERHAPPDSLEGKAAGHRGNMAEAIGQNFSSVKFVGIWCDFWAVDPDQIAQLSSTSGSATFTEEEVMLSASASGTSAGSSTCARAWSRDDYPAEAATRRRALTRTVPSAGQAIGSRDVPRSLQEYYRPRVGRERRAHRSQTRRDRRRRPPLERGAGRRRYRCHT